MKKVSFKTTNFKGVKAEHLFDTEYSKEMRLSLQANAIVELHAAPHDHLVQVLKGEVNMEIVNCGITTLKELDLIEIKKDVLHGLTAIEDSIIRVSIYKD